MKKTFNCSLLLITFLFIFIYLQYLEIPIYLDSNLTYFISNPVVRFIFILLIIYVAENISLVFSIILILIYLFLLNNSIRSFNFEKFTNEETISNALDDNCQENFNITNGASLNQTNPIPPPGSSQLPKGPEPLYPNTNLGPLPFRPCETVLASGSPDYLPPKGQGFLGDPSGPYTDSGVGCKF